MACIEDGMMDETNSRFIRILLGTPLDQVMAVFRPVHLNSDLWD